MAKPNRKIIFPWVSLFLVVVHVLFFIWERQAIRMGLTPLLSDDFAFQWTRFLSDPLSQCPTLLSHTFLHADAAHLIGNLLFFLLFGPAVEKALGSFPFFVGYLFWGAAAAITQGSFSPFSSGLIGASGAVSGAAGAFFVLYPLKTPFLRVPAFLLVGGWFLLQIGLGYYDVQAPSLYEKSTQIGYWAHAGGFAAGALTIIPFLVKSIRKV